MLITDTCIHQKASEFLNHCEFFKPEDGKSCDGQSWNGPLRKLGVDTTSGMRTDFGSILIIIEIYKEI